MTDIIKDWLIRRDDGAFTILVDTIYPRILAAMQACGERILKAAPRKADGSPDVPANSGKALLIESMTLTEASLDQFWLELVFQVTKLEAQRLIFHSDLDARSPERPTIGFHFKCGANKARWQLKRRPPGRGVEAATHGGAARRVFEELRGAIPR